MSVAKPANIKQEDNRGLLSKIASGLSGAVTGAPRGLWTLGGELLRLPNPAITATRAAVNREPLQVAMARDAQELPALTDIATGFQRTGARLINPARLVRDYSSDPVGTALEDVGNVGIVLTGGAAAATKLGTAAPRLAGAARIVNTVADAPLLPYRAALRAPSAIGRRSLEAATAAGGQATRAQRIGMKLSPTYQGVQAEILRSRAVDEGISDSTAASRMTEAHILPDPDERMAATSVLEATAPTLARVRAAVPDDFADYVAETYGDSLSPRAAALAADVAEGRLPELAARIQQAAAVNAEYRATAEAAHIERRPWQAEDAANPLAVRQAVRKAGAGLAAAEKKVDRLTARLAKADEKDRAGAGRAVEAATNRVASASRALAAAQQSADVVTARGGLAVREGAVRLLEPAGGPVGRSKLAARTVGAADTAAGRAFRSGTLEGTAAQRLHIAENLARSAEARSARISTGAVSGPLGRPLRAQLAKAESRVARINDKAKFAAEKAANKVENAPSRFRPVLAENRAAQKYLTSRINELRGEGLPSAAARLEEVLADIPGTLADLAAAGISPEFLYHTQPRTANKAARVASRAGLPKPFKPGSDRKRTASLEYNRDFADGQMQGRREAQTAEARREAASRVDRVPGATARMGRGHLTGVASAQGAIDAGFTVWDPQALFDTSKARTLDEIDVALGLGDDIMFMPTPLFQEFRNYFQTADPLDTLGAITDVPNRLYYIARLALSPAYIPMQVFGNAMMLAATAPNPQALGRGIATVVRSIRESGGVRQARKSGIGFPEGIEPRILRSGQTAAELSRLKRAAEDVSSTGLGGWTTRKLQELTESRPLQWNFRWANFIDNASRAAAYFAQIDAGKAPDEAVRATLRAMGEFEKVSPFERDVIRRLMPMYVWHREITRLSFKLAVDHPLRVAWTLHIGATAGQADGPIPDFFEGWIPGGSLMFDTGGIFPYGEMSRQFEGGFLGAGKYLGPTPKLLIQNTLGVSPSTGRSTRTTFGDTTPSIARQIASLAPQSRLVEGLVGRNTVQRFADGTPVTVSTEDWTQAQKIEWAAANPGKPLPGRAEVPTGANRLTAVLNALGLPTADRALVEQQGRSAAAREAAERQRLAEKDRLARARARAGLPPL